MGCVRRSWAMIISVSAIDHDKKTKHAPKTWNKLPPRKLLESLADEWWNPRAWIILSLDLLRMRIYSSADIELRNIWQVPRKSAQRSWSSRDWNETDTGCELV
jgi:hypothetical protein